MAVEGHEDPEQDRLGVVRRKWPASAYIRTISAAVERTRNSYKPSLSGLSQAVPARAIPCFCSWCRTAASIAANFAADRPSNQP